jgi:hypothetical protein
MRLPKKDRKIILSRYDDIQKFWQERIGVVNI